MLAPLSVGVSKSGEATKVTKPVLATMLNFDASVPPSVKLSVDPASASVAVAAYTVPVAFSAKLAVAALVMTGALSLRLVTDTSTGCVVVLAPSLAITLKL